MPEPTRVIADKDVIAGYNGSGSTITAKKIVKRTGSGDQQIALATAGSDVIFGVTMNDIADKSYGGVQTQGKAVVTAGAALATRGVRVTSDGSGRAVAAVAGDTILGILETAASGADVDCEVWIDGSGATYAVS
jgi:hypothetical protein